MKDDDSIQSKERVPLIAGAIDFFKNNKTVIILCSIIFIMFALLLNKDNTPKRDLIIDNLSQTEDVDASQKKPVTPPANISTEPDLQQEKVLPAYITNNSYSKEYVLTYPYISANNNYLQSAINAYLISNAKTHSTELNEQATEGYTDYTYKPKQHTNVTHTSKQPTAGKEIDLGLSVKWSSCNLGASKPEEFGNYYAWGETDEKNEYNEENYFNAHTNQFGFTSAEVIMPGISGTQYDASKIIMGDRYRIPTKDEMKELILNCKWEYSVINNVEGMLVTGTNGNSIFIPEAGHVDGLSHKLLSLYWTSTATNRGASAYSLRIESSRYHSEADIVNYSIIHLGLPIRPVISK